MIYGVLAFVIASAGSRRKIGFGWALFWSLVLSPLIGGILVAISPEVKAGTSDGSGIDNRGVSYYPVIGYERFEGQLVEHLFAPDTPLVWQVIEEAGINSIELYFNDKKLGYLSADVSLRFLRFRAGVNKNASIYVYRFNPSSQTAKLLIKVK